MRMLWARSARLSLAAILLASASCQELHTYYGPATVRVVVLFDPDPNLAPPRNCGALAYTYSGNRTADVAVEDTADFYDGDSSVSDTQLQPCASRAETFTFPDNAMIKQGIWTFQVDVFVDGVKLFGGTCSAVTILGQAYTVQSPLYVITFTQPQSGATAACTFTI